MMDDEVYAFLPNNTRIRFFPRYMLLTSSFLLFTCCGRLFYSQGMLFQRMTKQTKERKKTQNSLFNGKLMVDSTSSKSNKKILHGPIIIVCRVRVEQIDKLPYTLYTK